MGYDHALFLVVWWRDTFKDLQAFHGCGTTGGLVWDHASNGLVEDAGGGSEMEWATAGWVVSGHFAEVGMVLDCWRMLLVFVLMIQWEHMFVCVCVDDGAL